MKKSLILISLVAASIAAADIIRPGNVSTKTVTGEQAESLYNSLSGGPIPGDSLRTRTGSITSTYKVERSENGLKQVVCEKTVTSQFRNVPTPVVTNSFRCTIQESTNGQPVPEFKPHPRMG